MKLKTGQIAPNFITTDIWGDKVDLYQINKKVLISFFRYANCPLCNLQISQIMQYREFFKAEGIHLIAIFESSEQSLKNSIAEKHQFEFTLIADPDRNLYKTFNVRSSWFKTLLTMRFDGIGRIFTAFRAGYMPGKVEGRLSQIPADFLLNEKKVIEMAHYGKHAGDHLQLGNLFSNLNNQIAL